MFSSLLFSLHNISSNLLRPPGTTLRPATFLVKVYRAEDIPQMDTGLFEGVKKLFSKGPPKELVDPFCRFTFAGQEVSLHPKVIFTIMQFYVCEANLLA